MEHLKDPKKLAIVIAVVVVIVILAFVVILALALGIGLGVGLSSSGGGSSSSPAPTSTVYPGGLSATCSGNGSLSNPPLNITFVKNIQGQTGWFASPIVADLNADGNLELISAYYAVYVYDSNFKLLDSVDPTGTSQYRVYAPHAVANLAGTGNTLDLIFGQGQVVYCYTFNGTKLIQKWASTSAGGDYEIRGLAVGNIAGGTELEVIATTTITNGTSIFAYDLNGQNLPGWPRYNLQDATVNGFGNSGYGQYGLNVGLGDVSDTTALEVVATFDDHQIQLFRGDGTSVDASTYYTYPGSGPYFGYNMTWGQFIRWYNANDETELYHNHTGYPNLQYEPWMQWTQSPPSVADLDRDGLNEVICVSNIETAPNNPNVYVTQAWALAVFNGDYNNLGATRKTGWNVFPKGGSPIQAPSYPPVSPPAAAVVNILGDSHLEIIVSLNDGNMYCYSWNATRLWNYNFLNGNSVAFSTEPVIADLNADGSPEVIFATYGLPNVQSGYLIILAADGSQLANIKLNTRGESNGNGNGVPAAPTVADINGDGHLEIFLQSFEHGTDVYTVLNSNTACIPWATARGGYLRTGAPS